MKTAMQELKDNSLFTEGEEYIQIVLKKTEWIELLEKEKEQIIDFHVMLMKKGLEQEGNEIEWNYDELKKEAEDYYNQTYNQNK
jgi:hypothetical protein